MCLSFGVLLKEKFRKLLDVNERLVGMIDLINPTRELVKEGKIIRISARDGDHIERYLFLVSLQFVQFLSSFSCCEC